MKKRLWEERFAGLKEILTANLRYDVQNSFGVGNALFYLPEMDEEGWQDEYVQYSFWDGRGYLRANAVDEDRLLFLFIQIILY